ncbi:hypothetical protein VPNG_10087 [Cytospora leucostoma]|uniref:Myb-like domain-containing protein n=1 Tax=Cytospora leucostoma TaxID=1230097 RepID=A0A423VIY8_9PEZI|nr:hypothetical protein VPNG_10087 [Cytospora leucostoma]
MGNESSQLERTGEQRHHDGRLIGPAMSPTPSINAGSEAGRVIGDPMSPLPPDGEAEQATLSSPKSSKKRKRRRKKGVDAVTSPEDAAKDTTSAISDGEGNAPPGSTVRAKRKKTTHKVDDGSAGDVVVDEDLQPDAPNRNNDESPQWLKKKPKRRSRLSATHNNIDLPDEASTQEQQISQDGPANEVQDEPQADGLQFQGILSDGKPQREPELLQSPQSSKKRRPRNKKRDSVRSPEAPHLVSHAVGGSPPSAQQADVNNVSNYEPNLVVDEEEDIIPSSVPSDWRRGNMRSRASDIDARQSKTEGPVDNEDDDEPSEDQPADLVNHTGIENVTRDFSTGASPDVDLEEEDFGQEGSQWLHKREMDIDSDEEPITDTRTSQERDEDAALPDLEPSQIKSEPPDYDSDSQSPSAARLGRLERSRSRSMSRASATRLADEAVSSDPIQSPTPFSYILYGIAVKLELNAQPPNAMSFSGRSSTGSISSIPARIVDPDLRSTSTGSSSSDSDRSGHNAGQTNGDNLDADQVVINGSPPKSQAKRGPMTRKKAAELKLHGVMDIDGEAENNTPEETVDETVIPQETSREGGSPQGVPEEASTQEVTGQPKRPRKKRRLQPKKSISLSQLEGTDVDGEGEGQSRLPGFSTASKLKDVMRGGSNEPGEGENGEGRDSIARTSAIPQAQSRLSEDNRKARDAPLPKPKRAKRKRRDDASDDELESLMARNASKSLGLSDDERGQRRRLPSNQKANGPWTTDELTALGRVVSVFCDSHDMSQQEVNAMIHERPDASNGLHTEFWSMAASDITRRTRKQIVERARRMYNNFVARGTWTEEQKQEVHELFEKHGKKFSEIAGMINRDQKDVRDYWRNQYLVHETQVKARWTKEEAERLKEVVEEHLGKIRSNRENYEGFRPRPRSRGFDDEALLDWEQISAAMSLTRSRQQCKWKWTDMKEKGVAGEDTRLSQKRPSQKSINGISQDLANAREDYRGMSIEDKLRLIEAIHDSGASEDGRIRWNTLVDERFRTKWHRPTLKLVWYRLRKAVPDHDEQDVQTNARFLLNYYNTQQSLPEVGDDRVDEQIEERVISHKPGSRIWKKPSDEPRAVRERQRRSVSASSRASSRGRRLVSSQILRIAGSDDEDGGGDRTRGLRSDSVDLGLDDGDEDGERRSARKKPTGRKGKGRSGRKSGDDVPIRIPTHLSGKAAEKALKEARARAQRGKEAKRNVRSASVAVDSESE